MLERLNTLIEELEARARRESIRGYTPTETNFMRVDAKARASELDSVIFDLKLLRIGCN